MHYSIKTEACMLTGLHSIPKGRGGNLTPFLCLRFLVWNLSMTGDFFRQGLFYKGWGFCVSEFYKIKGHAVGITQFMIQNIKNSIEKTGAHRLLLWRFGLYYPLLVSFPTFQCKSRKKLDLFYTHLRRPHSYRHYFLKSLSSDTGLHGFLNE